MMKKRVIEADGFIMNNYDATYREAHFICEEKRIGNQRNVRIREFNGGVEIILCLVETPPEREKKPNAWQNNISRKTY